LSELKIATRNPDKRCEVKKPVDGQAGNREPKERTMNRNRRSSFVITTGVLFGTLLTALALVPAGAWAHCEIPCGIYDDAARIQMMKEDAGTIEKSMRQVVALSGKSPVNYNQLVRWITNKEAHADKIQHVAAQYFMTQRISLDAKGYGKKLGALHQILVYAMKCKQTTDLENVEKLRSAIKAFSDLYFDHSHE
jgi:nickel superoxide dismutase